MERQERPDEALKTDSRWDRLECTASPDAREFAARLELCDRLTAVVDELDALHALRVDVDVPLTLAVGLLEDVKAALDEEPA